MALSSILNRNAYIGNGAVDTYAYAFRIVAASDLRVTVRDDDSLETTLVLNTDYTVTGVGNSSGGNVVLVNSGQAWLDADGDLESGFVISIRRVRPLTQLTDIRNQGDFFPETHEDAFDHFIMVDQQQQDEIDRSLKLPETIDPADFDTTLPADIQDNPESALIINAAGDGFAIGASATVDVDRMFNSDTYANLKADAAAAPTRQRWGWATDIQQLMFYTADLTVGDSGWIVAGG